MIQNKRFVVFASPASPLGNRRLRCAGFHEYGSRYAPAAAACIQAHLQDFSRSPSCMTKSLPGIWGLSAEKSYWICWHRKRSTLEAFIQIADWKSLTMKSRAQEAAAVAVAARQSPCVHISADVAPGRTEADPVRADRALLSKISFNEGENIPGIAHAVVLEAVEN